MDLLTPPNGRPKKTVHEMFHLYEQSNNDEPIVQN